MDDVVIAGAGPAGALAAYLLARGGARVTLLDRARFPRAKLCGDTLNPGAVALLARHFDLAPLAARGRPIYGMRLTGPGGVAVRGDYGNRVAGLGVTREVLDAWLVERAVAAGARLVEAARVTGPVLDRSGQVQGVVASTSAAAPSRFPATVTIGADGSRSVLGRALGLTRTPRWPRRWAIGAYFDEVAGLDAVGEMHVRPGCYVGVAPTAGGGANACLVRAPDRGARWARPADQLWAALGDDPELGPRFSSARLRTAPVVLGPLAVDAPVPGAPGLFLVGDAAGFVDPMTGDGIHLALQAAELAAGTALAVLGGGLEVRTAHLGYARALRAQHARKRRFNRALRRMVAAPRGVGAAAVCARLCPAAFRAIIRYAGDVPARQGR